MAFALFAAVPAPLAVLAALALEAPFGYRPPVAVVLSAGAAAGACWIAVRARLAGAFDAAVALVSRAPPAGPETTALRARAALPGESGSTFWTTAWIASRAEKPPDWRVPPALVLRVNDLRARPSMTWFAVASRAPRSSRPS